VGFGEKKERICPVAYMGKRVSPILLEKEGVFAVGILFEEGKRGRRPLLETEEKGKKREAGRPSMRKGLPAPQTEITKGTDAAVSSRKKKEKGDANRGVQGIEAGFPKLGQ